jgi:hypothetical protein
MENRNNFANFVRNLQFLIETQDPLNSKPIFQFCVDSISSHLTLSNLKYTIFPVHSEMCDMLDTEIHLSDMM